MRGRGQGRGVNDGIDRVSGFRCLGAMRPGYAPILNVSGVPSGRVGQVKEMRPARSRTPGNAAGETQNDGIVPSTCRFHDFRGCNGGAWALSVRRCLSLSEGGRAIVGGVVQSSRPGLGRSHSKHQSDPSLNPRWMVSQFGSWRLHCDDNSWWPQGKEGKWEKACQHGPLLFVQS